MDKEQPKSTKGSPVYFELQQLGNTMRVAAIDSQTGTEIVIQGPAQHSTTLLQKMALKKLNYVLNKKKGE